jgi:hypothetical protein
MGQKVELGLPDLWVVQVLRTAGGSWVAAEKIVAVLCAIKLHCPMPGLNFELRNGALRSPEVEEALRRLAALGLVEESRGAYRLTKKGSKLAERILPNSAWTLPYADVVFYLAWDVRQLAEYIRTAAAVGVPAR